MSRMMLENATTFERLWTSMAGVGIGVFIWLGWLAWGDRSHLEDPIEGLQERRALGARRIIATQNITVALLLGGVELSLGLGGLISMFLPNANRQLSTTGAIILFSLFAAHCFLVSAGFVLFVARTRLLAKIEADRQHMAAMRAHARIEEGE